MRMTFDCKALAEAMSKGVSTSKNGLSVLEHALFTAIEDGVRITTADGEQEHSIEVLYEAQAVGDSVLLHAANIKQALQGMDGEAVIELVEERCTLTQGRRHYPIKFLRRVDLLPQFDWDASTPMHGVDSSALSTAMARVEYAAGKSDARYYLNGVLITPAAVVATDGLRLAVDELDTGMDFDAIVPRAALARFRSMLENDGGLSSIEHRALAVNAGNERLIVKLIDGVYPDWSRVVVDSNKQRWHVPFDGEAVRQMARRMVPFVTRKLDSGHTVVGAVIAASGGKLTMFNSGQDVHDEIDVGTDADTEETGINIGFLQDALAVIGTEAIWHGSRADTAQLFTAKDRTDRHVIMPMRT